MYFRSLEECTALGVLRDTIPQSLKCWFSFLLGRTQHKTDQMRAEDSVENIHACSNNSFAKSKASRLSYSSQQWHQVPSLLRSIHTRPFIWDHIHLRPRHLWQHSFELIQSRSLHLRPHEFQTTFIWDHSHFRPHSFETTFIWDHSHFRPHSFETTFIWDHNLLGPLHLRQHSFETTFFLCHVEAKLFWFTVYHIFMIYLSLLCGRPEVLQGASSFEVL